MECESLLSLFLGEACFISPKVKQASHIQKRRQAAALQKTVELCKPNLSKSPLLMKRWYEKEGVFVFDRPFKGFTFLDIQGFSNSHGEVEIKRSLRGSFDLLAFEATASYETRSLRPNFSQSLFSLGWRLWPWRDRANIFGSRGLSPHQHNSSATHHTWLEMQTSPPWGFRASW